MKLKLSEITLFSLLGTVMFISKIVMEFLPNIHLLAMLTLTFTVVFRKKALIPIYIFVFINGIYCGFNAWWIPYLYLWAVLWGATMLIPKKISPKVAVPIYMVLCALHGFLYGTLYAPAQALMFGLTFKQMLIWIATGFPFDAIHGISNFFLGALVLPLSSALKKVTAHIDNGAN